MSYHRSASDASLPPNWGKLGLTDAQKKEVHRIPSEYRAVIDRLE